MARDNGFKQKEGRYRSDGRGNFFTSRVVRHWNKLPSDAVEPSLLEVLKATLVFEQPDLVEGLPAHGRVLEPDDL